MRRRFAILPILLALVGIDKSYAQSGHATAPNNFVGAIDAEQALVDKLHFWESRYHESNTDETLKKLLTVAPNNLEGLYALIRKQVKAGDFVAARETLKLVTKETEDVNEVLKYKSYITLFSENRFTLDRARLNGKTGRIQESLDIYKSLFPYGIPTPDLELEVLLVERKLPDSWRRVSQGLNALSKRNPHNLHIKVAYLDHEVDEAIITPPLLKALEEMSHSKVFESTIGGAWRKALRRLNRDQAHSAQFQRYFNRFPLDQSMRLELGERKTELQERARRQADPNYQNRLAGLSILEDDKASPKRLKEAKRRLLSAQKHFPKDVEITGGLGYVALRQGAYDSAINYFQQALTLSREQSDMSGIDQWQSLIVTARYWGFIAKAKINIDRGRFAKAEQRADQAIEADKNESTAWRLKADIARERDRVRLADKHYRHALKLDPLDDNALRGLADLYAERGHYEKALFIISKYSRRQRQKISDYSERLRVTYRRDSAEKAVMEGETERAKQKLLIALRENPKSAWLRYDLANIYREEGHVEHAVTLFEEGLMLPGVDHGEMRHAYALLLSALDRYNDSTAQLELIERADWSAGMRALYGQLNFEAPLERSRTADDDKEKRRALMEAEANINDDRSHAILVAKQWLVLKDRARTRALIDRYLIEDNHANDTTHTENRIKITNDQLLGLADLYYDLGEIDKSREIVENILLNEEGDLTPDQTFDALYLGFIIASEARDSDESRRYASDALHIARSKQNEHEGQHEWDQPNYRHREGDSWEVSKLKAWLSEDRDLSLLQVKSAIDYRFRSETEGLSDLHAVTVPVEVKFPWHIKPLQRWMRDQWSVDPRGQGYFRVEYVDLYSGHVDRLNQIEDSYEFGSLLLCSALCSLDPIKQEDSGIAFALGYRQEYLHIDLGTTPRGFLIEDWVGGIEVDGRFRDFTWTVDVEKRAVTGSLLSYAGALDHRTDQVWGGVRRTGVDLSASFDQGGDYGWWGLLGWHGYSGENVKRNRRTRLLSGLYWRLLEDAPYSVDVGLRAMWFSFSEDLGEFTFGHGGYYSPQQYFSIAAPVDLYGRKDDWSFLVRVSLSVSNAKDDTVEYYPNDPNLQAQAEANQIFSSVSPFFEGGSDTSVGFEVTGRIEYPVSDNLFFGGSMHLERSEFYAPNWVQIWLRYYFDTPSAGVNVPPQPMILYMDF